MSAWTSPHADLLTPSTVVPYLARRGVVGPAATAHHLGGGVSNVVLAVQDGESRVVLKQSRERLAVAEEWLAPRARIVREAQGLRTAARLTPEVVPAVLDLDDEAMTMTIEAAPQGWHDWKSDLMAARVDPDVGALLGASLGVWQAATAGGAHLSLDLREDTATFGALRVDPYHRTAAARNPGVEAAVLAVVDRMTRTRVVLVHGDFSPKNVLVGPGGAWVLDFEVAHFGDPLFDPAFLLTHLALKGLRRAADVPVLRATATAFLAAYEARTASVGLPIDAATLGAHVGCLLLARADGKSPVEYLDGKGRGRARAIGTDLLARPVPGIDDLWNRLWRTP